MKNIKKMFVTNKNILTYSWTKHEEISHKISGHIFEACDQLLSYNLRNPKNKELDWIILIPENNIQLQNNIMDVIKDKYDIFNYEIIKNNIVFNRPLFVKCNGDVGIIIVDGVPPDAELVLTNENASFTLQLCGNDFWWLYNSTKNKLKNTAPRINKLTHAKVEYDFITLAYTEDIHEDYIFDLINKQKVVPHNILERINLDNLYYKTLTFKDNFRFYNISDYCDIEYPENFENTMMLYTTGNCRSLKDWYDKVSDNNLSIEKNLEHNIILNTFVEEILYCILIEKIKIVHIIGVNEKDYTLIAQIEKYINSSLNKKDKIIFKLLDEEHLPVYNFHNTFNVYFYTPNALDWDCNPRLLQESLFYHKNVYISSCCFPYNKALKYVIKRFDMYKNLIEMRKKG